MLTRKTVPITNSLRARIAIAVLGVFGYLTAPIKNRGFSRVANFVAKYIAPEDADVRVWLSEDTQFAIDLKDAYWSRLVSSGYQYEPELHALCMSLKHIDYLFLDCGANKGYWSLLVSGAAMGSKKVIAVEPLPDTFASLSKNAALNGRGFSLLRYAISSESGMKMNLYFRGDHSGSTLEQSWNHNPNANTEVFEVESRSIDDVLARMPDCVAPVVIKLDIEGHEITALKGATGSLTSLPLVIFEEHGGARNADLTEYIRKELGLSVFFLEDDGSVAQVMCAADVISRKKNPQKGYNLCACSCDSVFYSPLAASAKSGRATSRATAK